MLFNVGKKGQGWVKPMKNAAVDVYKRQNERFIIYLLKLVISFVRILDARVGQKVSFNFGSRKYSTTHIM